MEGAHQTRPWDEEADGAHRVEVELAAAFVACLAVEGRCLAALSSEMPWTSADPTVLIAFVHGDVLIDLTGGSRRGKRKN